MTTIKRSMLRPGDCFYVSDMPLLIVLDMGAYPLLFPDLENPICLAAFDPRTFEIITWTSVSDFLVDRVSVAEEVRERDRQVNRIVQAAEAFAKQDEAFLNGEDGADKERERLIVDLLTAAQILMKGDNDAILPSER